MKIDFVMQGYASGKVPVIKSAKDAVASSSNGAAGTSSASGSSSNSKVAGPSEIDIQSVLDVLPHLEVPFVRKLLTRYENTESAIAAVLEGNLPPDLDETIHLESPSMEKKIDEPIQQVTEMMENQKLDSNDREIVKIKSQVVRPKAEKRFLDDKSSIKEFHARNIEHGYVDMIDEYDDEYDDSYDAVVESESKSRKILRNTGAINELVDEVEDSEESDSDDENIASGEQRDRTRDFCENPEAARERWARNREAKYGNKRPPPRPQGYVPMKIFFFV